MKKINILAGITLLACGLYSCDNQSENFAVTSSSAIKVKVAEKSSTTRSISLESPVSTDIIDCGDFSIGVTEYASYDFSNMHKSQTRASIIDNEEINKNGSSFKMDAYTDVEIVDRATDTHYGTHPFNNATWTTNGSQWTCSTSQPQTQYWSLDNTYYMWSYVGVELQGTDKSERSFTMTQDGTNDVLVAYNEETRGENEADPINIEFLHPMAAIQFQAEKFVSEGYKITNITISGIYNKTICALKGTSNGEIAFDHSPEGEGSYTLEGELASGEGASDDMVLFVVPQELDEHVTITWTIESTKTGENVIAPMTRTATFNASASNAKHQWQAGRRYVYELGSGIEKTVSYRFNNVDWSSYRTIDGGEQETIAKDWWIADTDLGTSYEYGNQTYSAKEGKGNINNFAGWPLTGLNKQNALGFGVLIGSNFAMRGILNDPLLVGQENLYVTQIIVEYSAEAQKAFGQNWASFNLSLNIHGTSNDQVESVKDKTQNGEIKLSLGDGYAYSISTSGKGLSVEGKMSAFIMPISVQIKSITIYYIPWEENKTASTL